MCTEHTDKTSSFNSANTKRSITESVVWIVCWEETRWNHLQLEQDKEPSCTSAHLPWSPAAHTHSCQSLSPQSSELPWIHKRYCVSLKIVQTLKSKLTYTHHSQKAWGRIHSIQCLKQLYVCHKLVCLLLLSTNLVCLLLLFNMFWLFDPETINTLRQFTQYKLFILNIDVIKSMVAFAIMWMYAAATPLLPHCRLRSPGIILIYTVNWQSSLPHYLV